MSRLSLISLYVFALTAAPVFGEDRPIPPLPEKAELAFDEDWSSGKIDPERWYPLRKQWGKGNFGVVPENLRVVEDTIGGVKSNVLLCEAHGDRYSGEIIGKWGNKKRVGGVLVSKQHFASGRFEVQMKIGSAANPTPPGIVPAIWTYGYRMVKVDPELSDQFLRDTPLYHPYLQEWGKGMAFYWSEIDFPEFGKAGDFARPKYNTFLNKKHHSEAFDAHGAADGAYHTYTTDWRTHLVPIEGVKDAQVEEAEGYFWIRDKAVPYDKYWGNPLKKLAPERYAVCSGQRATHWIDGKFVGENTKFVPSMSAQLNVGVWLPDWAGEAPWDKIEVRFGRIRVWQYGDKGDVTGILKDDITDSFEKSGKLIPPK